MLQTETQMIATDFWGVKASRRRNTAYNLCVLRTLLITQPAAHASEQRRLYENSRKHLYAYRRMC